MSQNIFYRPFGNILATGDFRYTPSMFNDTRLASIKIDKCYMDNSFFNKIYNNIPSQENAKNAIIDLIAIKKGYRSSAVFAVDVYKIGKEKLLIDLCKTFGTKVAVSAERLQRYSSYLCEDDLEYFTLELKRNTLFYVKDDEENFAKNFQNRTKFCVRPSAFIYKESSEFPLRTSLKNLVNYYSNSDIRNFQIPYSDHSSYREIIDFIKQLKPIEIEFDIKSEDFSDISKVQPYLSVPEHQFFCKLCFRIWLSPNKVNKINENYLFMILLNIFINIRIQKYVGNAKIFAKLYLDTKNMYNIYMTAHTAIMNTCK